MALNFPVELSNEDDAGVRSWRWALISKPIGSNAVLSSPVSATPSFTPDLAGTYLVELKVDAGGEGQRDRRIAAVLTDYSGSLATPVRIPSGKEDDEANWKYKLGTTATPNDEGWWPDLLELLNQVATPSGSSSAVAGEEGAIYDSLQLYIDAADRNSYPGTGTTVTDLISASTGTLLNGAVVAEGAFRVDNTVAAREVRVTRPSSTDDIFDGGGTLIVVGRSRESTNIDQILATTMTTGEASGWSLKYTSRVDDRYNYEFERAFSTTVGRWETYDSVSLQDPRPIHARTGVHPASVGTMDVVAVTYDSSSASNDPEMWINNIQRNTTLGLEESSAPVGTRTSDAGNALILGNNADDDKTLRGDVATILLFDRILTDAEISQVSQVFATRYGTTLGRATSDNGELTAQDMRIVGGTHTATSGTATAGSVHILGGDSRASNNGAKSGDVSILAGNSTAPFGQGGRVLIQGGSGVSATSGNSVEVAGGAISSGGNGVAPLVLRGGDNLGSGAAGDVLISGGDRSGGSGEGAGVGLRSGSNNSPGPGVVIRSGGPRTGSGGTTADIQITTQVANDAKQLFGVLGSSTTDTGDIEITTEVGLTNTSNKTGNISITCGDVSATTGNDPGDITITAGGITKNNANAVGGSISLTAGTGFTTNGGGGGNITLTAGDNITTGAPASTARPGAVTIVAGDNNGSGANALGGDVDVTAGEGTEGGAVTITGGVGGSLDGGNCVLVGGAGGSDGGHVDLVGGESTASGADGAVRVRTNGAVDGTVHRSIEMQSVASAGTDTLDLLTLANNGSFTTLDIHLVGMDDADTAAVYSRKITTSFYRSGGTVSELGTRHVDDAQTIGAPGATADIAISSDIIQLQISRSTTLVMNWSATLVLKPRIF